jgi:hypothetical protein
MTAHSHMPIDLRNLRRMAARTGASSNAAAIRPVVGATP